MSIRYVRTRSGQQLASVPEPPVRSPVRVVYWSPKPAWMDHVPGRWLRFGDRQAFEAHVRREARP